jgi:protein-disulfide isomerase
LCADSQGKFWEMHDHLFRHQRALEYEDLVTYAADLQLDIGQFKRETDEHVHNSRIERDREDGWNSGVREISTLFVNDVRYEGVLTLAALSAYIEKEQEKEDKPTT